MPIEKSGCMDFGDVGKQAAAFNTNENTAQNPKSLGGVIGVLREQDPKHRAVQELDQVADLLRRLMHWREDARYTLKEGEAHGLAREIQVGANLGYEAAELLRVAGLSTLEAPCKGCTFGCPECDELQGSEL